MRTAAGERKEMRYPLTTRKHIYWLIKIVSSCRKFMITTVTVNSYNDMKFNNYDSFQRSRSVIIKSFQAKKKNLHESSAKNVERRVSCPISPLKRRRLMYLPSCAAFIYKAHSRVSFTFTTITPVLHLQGKLRAENSHLCASIFSLVPAQHMAFPTYIFHSNPCIPSNCIRCSFRVFLVKIFSLFPLWKRKNEHGLSYIHEESWEK